MHHPRPLIRLAIRVPAEHAEVVVAELVELAPAGFEQVDGDGHVEFALYGAPGELPELPEGAARIGATEVHVSTTRVADDWSTRWREFHTPAQIGRIEVRAPWHEPRTARADAPPPADAPPLSDGIDIVIDPAQAFGTGAHPTTRLCLQLLQEVTGGARRDAPSGGAAGNTDLSSKSCGTPALGALGAPGGGGGLGALADLGCGSGVLAIAAAKLGFGPVTAFDNEGAAVEATLANAAVNGVELESVERYDLRTRRAPFAPVTVANLVRPLLLTVAELWREPGELRPGELLPEQPETLIVSGLLEGEEDEVAAAFAPLHERRRQRLQGWSALLLTRP